MFLAPQGASMLILGSVLVDGAHLADGVIANF